MAIIDSEGIRNVSKVTTDNISTKKIEFVPGTLIVPRLFETERQVITPSGSLIIPHPLGVKPMSITAKAVCVTAEAGYAVGDMNYGPFSISSSGNDSNAYILDADATNIYVYYGSQANLLLILTKSGRTGTNATSANWRMIFTAMG